MRICNFIIYILSCGFSVAHSAYAVDPLEFLQTHNLPSYIIKEVKAAKQSLNRCLISGKYLLCVEGRIFPGISANAQARQGVLNGLNISVRNSLYNFASSETKSKNLKNQSAVKQTVNEGQNKGKIRSCLHSRFNNV